MRARHTATVPAARPLSVVAALLLAATLAACGPAEGDVDETSGARDGAASAGSSESGTGTGTEADVATESAPSSLGATTVAIPDVEDEIVTWQTDLRTLQPGRSYVFDGPAVAAPDDSDDVVLCFAVSDVGHDGVAWCLGTDMTLSLPAGATHAEVGLERRTDGWGGGGLVTVEITDPGAAPPHGILHAVAPPDHSGDDPSAPVADGCPALPAFEDMTSLRTMPDADPLFAEQVNVSMHSHCLTEEEAIAHVDATMNRVFFRDGLYASHHDCVGGFTYDIQAVEMTVYSTGADCDAAITEAAQGQPFTVVAERRAHSLADLERLADALMADPPSEPEHFVRAGVHLELGAIVVQVSAGADARHQDATGATLADTRPAREVLDDAAECTDCPVLLELTSHPNVEDDAD